MPPNFILASASPRRKQLLEEVGFGFEIAPAKVDEDRKPGENPQSYADRLAQEKAETAAARHPDVWVLGADTIVVADPGGEGETVFGKPVDAEDAVRMLTHLSGVEHRVTTSVALVRGRETGFDSHVFSSTARVFFRPLARSEIEDYVATGEPMDKAGAYAIQGGAAGFVDRYEGSWSAIVGLPVEETIRELAAKGVTPASRFRTPPTQ